MKKVGWTVFRKILFCSVFLVTVACQDVAFGPTPETPRANPVNGGSSSGSTGEETPVVTPPGPVAPVEPVEPVDPVDPVQPPVGPQVRLLKAPQDHLLGESTSVEFEVVLGQNPLKELQCVLNNNPFACDLGLNKIDFTGLSVGSYKVFVMVKDQIDLQSSVESSWKVGQSFRPVQNDQVISANNNKADVLFVIDNSASMNDEQMELGNRIQRFFEKLEPLDWRIGIITTDPYENDLISGVYNPLADGALLRFPNKEYYLTSRLSQSNAKKYFEETIFRPEIGNGHERGIHGVYRNLERLEDPTNDVNRRIRDFYRSDATFSVVLISDEDETVVNGVGAPLKDLNKSQGSELIKKVAQVWDDKKLFRFNSVIVRPGDQGCIKKDEKFGYAYSELSRLTQGVEEDICAPDYSGALQKIADQVLNLQKSFVLDCEPQDIDGDGQINFEVVRQGQGTVPAYKINKNKLEFETPPAFGRYQFRYYCL